MTVLCIVQARMASTRLPGKIAEVIGDEPMLGKVLQRLQRARSLADLTVATTTARADDLTQDIAERHGVTCIRGEELDVLDRFVQAAAQFPGADVLVRVTADCPFIDPDIVDATVALFAQSGVDYVSNLPADPQLRTFPLGLSVEVFGRDTLLAVAADDPSPAQREHVTVRMYRDPAFRTAYLRAAHDASDLRWTVDTTQDLDVARRLDALAGPEPYSWLDVLAAARAHPEIAQINAPIRQKAPDEVDNRWG